MRDYIRIHKNDMVAVAIRPLKKGTKCLVEDLTVTLTEDIPMGHKFALRDIVKGENIIKYGFPIGHAAAEIKAGAWVHTHNTETNLDDVLEYSYQPDFRELPPTKPASFDGFVRKDGRVGVRNELWILPTVGCVNSIAQRIAEQAQSFVSGSIDGVYAFPHPYGCSQMGEDQENFRKLIADLIRHPNAGGVLVLGLGCEYSNIDVIKEYLGDYDTSRVRFLVCQESDDEEADGLALLKELADQAKEDKRTPADASKLIIGMKCGGSDGMSGISANPVVGGFSDLLISKGGTTILTEVPEMFGAETILMNRCADASLFEKTVQLINDYKKFFLSHGLVVYENPSPGNKAGGITTLEDKSLGCTQKSGSAVVKGVLGYGDRVQTCGLQLLSAPGNDLVAATATAAAGAQIVLFTTGRGTPFGCPVPTIKIASNTPLAEKKKKWIDFDAGRLASGMSLEALSEELFTQVLAVASGKQVKAEEAGFHDMAIYKTGVTL